MGLTGKDIEEIRQHYNKMYAKLKSGIDQSEFYNNYFDKFSKVFLSKDSKKIDSVKNEVAALYYVTKSNVSESFPIHRIFDDYFKQSSKLSTKCVNKMLDILQWDRTKIFTSDLKMDDSGNVLDKKGNVIDDFDFLQTDYNFNQNYTEEDYKLDQEFDMYRAQERSDISLQDNEDGLKYTYTQNEIRNQIALAKKYFDNIDADASYLNEYKQSFSAEDAKFVDVENRYKETNAPIKIMGFDNSKVKNQAAKDMSIVAKESNSKMLSMYLAVSDEFSKRSIFSKIFLFVRTYKQHSFIKNCEQKLMERGFDKDILDSYKEMYSNESKINSIDSITLNTNNNKNSISYKSYEEANERVPGIEDNFREDFHKKSEMVNSEPNLNKDIYKNNDM